jgi:pimeloyl-ACP methyl ester carboxylesterase
VEDPLAGLSLRRSNIQLLIRSRRIGLLALLLLIVLTTVFSTIDPGLAASYSTATITIRGKTQSLVVYDPPPGAPRRPFQVIVTSGDIGWLGLPVDLAEYSQKLGFRTIGFNARAYLSSFSGRNEHLVEREIPGDYQVLVDWARSNPAFPRDVVVIGVSEGAGLSVLGMMQQSLLKGCKGVIALGMPVRTSLGWHWTDFPMWITKKDPREPQAETRAYLHDLKVPLVMIHSTRDEWDPIESARALYNIHPGPKRFISVDAVNHRFSDRIPEVMGHIERSFEWLQNPVPES